MSINFVDEDLRAYPLRGYAMFTSRRGLPVHSSKVNLAGTEWTRSQVLALELGYMGSFGPRLGLLREMRRMVEFNCTSTSPVWEDRDQTGLFRTKTYGVG